MAEPNLAREGVEEGGETEARPKALVPRAARKRGATPKPGGGSGRSWASARKWLAENDPAGASCDRATTAVHDRRTAHEPDRREADRRAAS
jgi:hypothetical protein